MKKGDKIKLNGIIYEFQKTSMIDPKKGKFWLTNLAGENLGEKIISFNELQRKK